MATGNCPNRTRLNLPLFLITRHKIQRNRFPLVRNYIIKKSKSLYFPPYNRVKDVNDELQDEKFETKNKKQAKEACPRLYSRHLLKKPEKTNYMAPNRYKIDYNKLSPCKNVIKWSYMSSSKPRRKRISDCKTDFYQPSESLDERFNKSCYRHKGTFLMNLRDKKPTSRFMVTNPLSCWRDPNDPGPAEYFPEIFEKIKFPKVYEKQENPHQFLRNSCVPEKNLSLSAPLQNMLPGPGRYNLLDDDCCELKTLRQRRSRFHRAFPEKWPKKTLVCKKKSICMKRQIFGHGYTRLFRQPAFTIPVPKKALTESRDSYRYSGISDVKTNVHDTITISTRLEDQSKAKTPISTELRYNCLVKARKRVQMKVDKKIVFGSGLVRFPETSKSAIIKPIIVAPKNYPVMQTRIEDIKPKFETTPERLRTPARYRGFPETRKSAVIKPIIVAPKNYPVMQTRIKDIKPKFETTPERLRTPARYRIRPFKFQPSPPLKMLINELKFHIVSDKMNEYYPKVLDINQYFKDDSISTKI